MEVEHIWRHIFTSSPRWRGGGAGDGVAFSNALPEQGYTLRLPYWKLKELWRKQKFQVRVRAWPGWSFVWVPSVSDPQGFLSRLSRLSHIQRNPRDDWGRVRVPQNSQWWELERACAVIKKNEKQASHSCPSGALRATRSMADISSHFSDSRWNFPGIVFCTSDQFTNCNTFNWRGGGEFS